MEHPARDPLSRPRLVIALACAGALFTLGFALTAQPQQASAGGLLPTLTLPTVTLPGVTTVTVPTVGTTTAPTSTTTVVSTTTVAVTPPSPVTTTTSASTTTESVRSTAEVTGAKRLRSGAISIPVSSVRAPARLRVVLKFLPGAHTTSVRAQVMDTRGYVVRGARVSVLSAPVRALMSAKAKLSADDGSAVFPVRPRKTTRLRTTVTLTIRAVDPAGPALANASSRLRLTIRAHS